MIVSSFAAAAPQSRLPGPYLVSIHRRRRLCAEVQARVADYFDVPLSSMTAPSSFRQMARPRQVAMYLLHKLHGKPLSEIGRRFGGRDHAIRRVEQLRASDGLFDAQIRYLTRELEGL